MVSFLVEPDTRPDIIPPHRLKVDEEDRLLLTTTGGAGLFVHCAVTLNTLWGLQRVSNDIAAVQSQQNVQHIISIM